MLCRAYEQGHAVLHRCERPSAVGIVGGIHPVTNSRRPILKVPSRITLALVVEATLQLGGSRASACRAEKRDEGQRAHLLREVCAGSIAQGVQGGECGGLLCIWMECVGHPVGDAGALLTHTVRCPLDIRCQLLLEPTLKLLACRGQVLLRNEAEQLAGASLCIEWTEALAVDTCGRIGRRARLPLPDSECPAEGAGESVSLLRKSPSAPHKSQRFPTRQRHASPLGW